VRATSARASSSHRRAQPPTHPYAFWISVTHSHDQQQPARMHPPTWRPPAVWLSLSVGDPAPRGRRLGIMWGRARAFPFCWRGVRRQRQARTLAPHMFVCCSCSARGRDSVCGWWVSCRVVCRQQCKQSSITTAHVVAPPVARQVCKRWSNFCHVSFDRRTYTYVVHSY
jgi:hypothetical protein